MLQVTLPQFLAIKSWEELDPDDEPFCLSRVYDDEVTLWISKTFQPFSNLHNNLVHRPFSSSLGTFYLEHQELAQSWHIDFYTLQDCLPYVKQKLPERLASYQRGLAKDDMHQGAMEIARNALMYHFRPVLNMQGNPDPADLPKKYIPSREH